MFALRSKLATLRWYAARPALYREAARRILRGQISTVVGDRKREREREQGRAWCRSQATVPQRLLTDLGIPTDVKTVAELHPEVWGLALAAVDACPVKMGGPASVDLLYHLVRHARLRRVVETGVASGWSSLAILLALREGGEGELISVDMPYPQRNNDAYVGCAVPTELRGAWTLVRRSDRDALDPALRRLGSIDLAHYDSDKSKAGRSFAYPRLWQALAPRGVLMSDDVEDNLVFRDFASEVGRTPWVFEKKPGNYVGVLVK